jgi:DNA-binding NtrC family response regulator
MQSARSNRLREFGPLVALVEDDQVMGQSVADWLAVGGYRVEWLRTGSEAVARIPVIAPDILICDIRLPDMNGEQVYSALAPSLVGVPILFVTGFGDVDQAVRLMKAGAADYVTKPFEIEPLLERVEALLAPRWQQTDGSVLGASTAIMRVERVLRRVADIDSTVLLTGPTGVGKEVAARFLHEIGPRSDRPFVAVNCAAVPGDLLESEMFGHERGAFTGAHARHHGYVERAHGGTLFLDEVSEITLSVQAKLLRLAQEHTFARVGGGEPLRSTARILAASNADLDDRVRRGLFRDDLYFRLSVITVAIPSLIERRDDILPLALRFVGEFAGRFGREVLGFTSAAQDSLLDHDFPGNVRELRNRIERGVALAEGPWIGVADIFPERISPPREGESLLTLAEARENAERGLIAKVLTETKGDVAAAASLLGVSRSTLFEKIRKLGVRYSAPTSPETRTRSLRES